MEILAFADLHNSTIAYKKIQKKIKKHKPDYIICLGDLTFFGTHIETMMRKLGELKKPLILLPGNHEPESILKKLSKKYKNITYAHRKIMTIKEYTFVIHGGGGFYDTKPAKDKDFEKFIRENKKRLKGKIILLTHAPPKNTKLDKLDWAGHVGCGSYTEFIKKYKPMLALSGHLHENFGVMQKKGKTLLCNPGPEGMVFKI
ncbi:metallophosphoesterase [Candidatus Woesearchaeota archaeon]|nr:metallophosphoesterase [Candidatus Woesearchaeota archaeon]MBW3016498.1 metallophosphoesterase [Candidatus Woesearchaeota archaeon]